MTDLGSAGSVLANIGVEPSTSAKRSFQGKRAYLARLHTRSSGTARHRIRWVLIVLMFIAAAVFFLQESFIREREADVFAVVLRRVFEAEAAVRTISGAPVIFWNSGEGWHALTLTGQCSVTLYAVAFLILSGIVLAWRHVRVGRVVVGAMVTLAGLALVNQMRLALIAYVYDHHGMRGFEWAHGFVGSSIMLGGVAIALAGFFLSVFRRGGRRARRTESPSRPRG